MDWAQLGVIIGAAASLVAALTGLIVQINAYRKAVDGKMDQLLALTAASSHAAGAKESNDAIRAATQPVSQAPKTDGPEWGPPVP